MQPTTLCFEMFMLLTLSGIRIHAGVITNMSDSDREISVDNNIMTKNSKSNVFDGKHKSLFPKTYLKVANSESYPNIRRNKESISEKIFISKNIPLMKDLKEFNNMELTKNPQVTVESIAPVGTPGIEDNKVKDNIPNLMNVNINISDVHTEDYEAEVSTNDEGNAPSDSKKSISIIDQESGIPNRDNKRKSLVIEFLEAHTIIPIKCDIHSDAAEPKIDFDEFIFLKEEPGEVIANENDYEMTTEFFMDESRFKRSINVIAEENPGTPVSGFKITGTDAILDNDLFFKNINS